MPKPIDAAGKTVLPGLIDVHVHLGGPGGFYDDWSKYDPQKCYERELESYLYCGVTAVRSAGDKVDEMLKLREQFNSGEKLGLELFLCGPLFTAEGGHGTEYAKKMPEIACGRVRRAVSPHPENARGSAPAGR